MCSGRGFFKVKPIQKTKRIGGRTPRITKYNREHFEILEYSSNNDAMKLAQLFSVYPQLKWGEDPNKEVGKIAIDSRAVEPGDVFVAIRGTRADGHQFLPVAVENGAIGLVVEDESEIPPGFLGAVVCVPNSREALDLLASRYFNNPAKDLFCIGVTGTNGKTSVTYMIESVLKNFGWKVGVLGTINHHIGDKVWESRLTTPDALLLQERLSQFKALGANAVAFEVSSHALVQSRADHIPFDVVVFTNLSRDHLDYHLNMDDYFSAKERLFRTIPSKFPERRTTAVINGDDEYGKKIQVSGDVRTWLYKSVGGDLSYQILTEDFSGCLIKLTTPRGEKEFKVPVPGRHNVENAVAAIGAGLAAGASLEVCCEGIEAFAGVPGRLEAVKNNQGKYIFVDYAHTDDALKSVLNSLKEIRKNSGLDAKIITVFGCGGDRDKGKRPLMATAAQEGSDFVFITSDNPRSEEPMDIINDCLQAVPVERLDHSVFVEQDRRAAIGRAIQLSGPGDVVLIAGKGHEDYQIIGDERLSFSDVDVAREFLSES